ncbi:MAG: hypothetical protein HOV81_03775 [Kofleriaceae bacterium]|nr:hypothetical protein [Kofleriaceae bacterium]
MLGRRSLALIVALSTVGCATRQQSRTTALVGGGTIVGGMAIGVGAIVLARNQATENDAFAIGFTGFAIAGVVAGIGAVLGVSGLVGMATLPDASTLQ